MTLRYIDYIQEKENYIYNRKLISLVPECECKQKRPIIRGNDWLFTTLVQLYSNDDTQTCLPNETENNQMNWYINKSGKSLNSGVSFRIKNIQECTIDSKNPLPPKVPHFAKIISCII